MKSTVKLFGSLVLLAFIGFAFTNAPVADTYTVDTAKSLLEWRGYKVTGQHNGTIKIKSGSLEFTEGNLTGGSFEIDMTSLSVDDLQAGKGKEKLEGHLKSPDFFGVEAFPTAKFQITKVVPRGTPGDYTIKGNLTIKESTKEIKFFAKVNMAEDGTALAEVEKVTIDRSEYNIRYGSGSFFENLGDKTIYDEFDLSIKLVASK